MKLSATAFVGFLLAQAHSTVALCSDGEVGIGRKQVYQVAGKENLLINDYFVIASNGCNDIGISDHQFEEDACSAGPGFGDGNGLSDCDGNGKPGFVWTKGGNYHNCYEIHGQTCATGPLLYESMYWCCQRW